MGTKVQRMTSIDTELNLQVKELNLNVSEILDNALREIVNNEKKVKIDMKEDSCEYCGKKDEKACYDNNWRGLTWIYPDERWICEGCLSYKALHPEPTILKPLKKAEGGMEDDRSSIDETGLA